jgi:hypothetical protein
MLAIGAFLAVLPIERSLHAQPTNSPVPQPAPGAVTDTNTLELIKQLQRRIEELEQKVRSLEQGKPPAGQQQFFANNPGGGAGHSAPAAVTRQDENVMFTRVQLAF